jgi:hypothetical protein
MKGLETDKKRLNKTIEQMVDDTQNRHLDYSPCRKKLPPFFPKHDRNDKSNFNKFVIQEPFDREPHLTQDMATKVSPFTNRKPFKVTKTDISLATDTIRDINSM